MSIGNRIYELRSKHNLSQEELANELQVSRQTISKWESEQSLPDTDRLIALCNYFKVSSDYLLFAKEDKKEVSYEWINAFLLSIVGFIVTIALWYQFQLASLLGVGLIIQLFGFVGYIIGNRMPKLMYLCFWGLQLIVPLSILISLFMFRIPYPYPSSALSLGIFAVVYGIALSIVNMIYKKGTTF